MDAVEELASCDKLFDDNVLDYTTKFLDEEEEDGKSRGQIKLKHGLDTSRLLSKEGALLIPEMDEELFKANSKPSSFYSDALNHGNKEKIDEMISWLGLNNEDGDRDDGELSDGQDLSTFAKKSRKMTGVTPDGGVKKRLLQPGLHSGGVAPARSTVTIHYSLFLEDQDEPYDSTVLRQKSERFKLDDGQMIPGLELAIKTMKTREKSEFLIDPKYAFGQMGCPPRIPGNSQIMAIIELIEFVLEGEADALLSMNPVERSKKFDFRQIELAAAREHKDGNKYVQKEEWKLAVRRYVNGFKLLEDCEMKNDEEEKRQRHLLVKLYSNSALCYIRIGWPKKCCLVCQDGLQIEPRNPKLLYRMGKAKAMLASYDDARKYLIRAANERPQDSSIGFELARVDRLLKAERDNEKAMYNRMMGNQGHKGKQRGSGGKKEFDDEDYEEMFAQLNAFKNDKTKDEFHLPSGMNESNIRLATNVAETVGGLELRHLHRTKQWKIVKTN